MVLPHGKHHAMWDILHHFLAKRKKRLAKINGITTDADEVEVAPVASVFSEESEESPFSLYPLSHVRMHELDNPRRRNRQQKSYLLHGFGSSNRKSKSKSKSEIEGSVCLFLYTAILLTSYFM